MGKATYPPGPRLPRLIQTIAFSQRRHQFMTAMGRRYGDVFTLRFTPPFSEQMVVFSRPEHIREIFAADPADLHAGEGNRALGALMGEHSVLLTDEAEHARARRLLMPAFTGSALHGYRELVAAIAKAHIDQWSPGSTVPALARMNDLTLDVIMQVVFGVTEEHRRAELAPLLRRTIQLDPIVFIGLSWSWLHGMGPWKRFYDDKSRLDELLFAEIARRRAHPDLDQRADVLSRLLAVGSGENPNDAPLSDEELRDQLVTLLLAGHETTASALAWAFRELAAAPEVQERARRAACEGDDKYVEAVLKEAMRRRTVIGGTMRRLTRDLTLCGWDLPAGTVVSTSIVLAHRNPDRHPDPDRFRPERFLDGSVATNTWFPFGGGVRRCIGASLALMEGTVVLREALSRYTMSLPPGVRDTHGRMRNITHVPADDARVVVAANEIRP
ncbi:cytochrome P450 [Nocardia transvalensis]|uniref:cytochrome P450 n=1 Tax=Nocardia transvalensis TaxID=37333 RepID=UPI0018940D7E|nr:cytochrome P450 [Nocardia transvalensis]MBF6328112.1 cytochrome P450 [Nocardia transvalensis]